MIYIVLGLFLLGAWQAFMNGKWSPLISSIAFLLAIIVLVVGLVMGKIDLILILWILFLIGSIAILMFLFNYSTYHSYFIYLLPILICYGVLIGYLFYKFKFEKYEMWHFGLTVVYLYIMFYRSRKIKKAMTDIMEGEYQDFVNKSGEKSLLYYALSSITYVISSEASYILFYNAN